MLEPSRKPAGGQPSGLSLAQLHALSSSQLRARALCLLEMADEVPDHEVELLLLELAVEFSTRAAALETEG
jgi:hypothetical protein